jgi:serine/threonine protein phosphatase PrpC
VEVQALELSKSERLLLCSDGLSGMIGDKQIWDIVEQSGDIQLAVESLISIAREHGGEDNITAILVGWEPDEG